MSLAATSLRLAVHGVNAGGRALARVGYQPVRLDADELLADARRATALDDFGDGAFEDPFRRVLEGCRTEARLTAVGRVAARAGNGTRASPRSRSAGRCSSSGSRARAARCCTTCSPVIRVPARRRPGR